MKRKTYDVTIRTILPSVILAACVSLACAADKDSNAVRVKVNDVRGKPAAGAELWLEKEGAKGAKKTLADATGQFTFKNLAPGAYKISAYDYQTPAAGATTFQASASTKGAAAVTISLGKISREAMTAKTKKRYVWVPGGETGSHIGGGKWVPVEENLRGTGSSAVDKSPARSLIRCRAARIFVPLPRRETRLAVRRFGGGNAQDCRR